MLSCFLCLRSQCYQNTSLVGSKPPLNKKAIRQDKLEAWATFVPEEHQMLEDRLVGASPVTHRIESFFAKFFLEKKEKRQVKGGGRVRPKYYGEALTEDALTV